MLPQLTIEYLQTEAAVFCQSESQHNEPSLYGISDGKAVGTYLEHKFKKMLHKKYIYKDGSSAKGIDFPELGVDIKATSIKQPQSSSPFKSAQQKIYGLNYSLMIFVYRKIDDVESLASKLNIEHAVFVDKTRTADYHTTRGILDIMEHGGDIEDMACFIKERDLPVDETSAIKIAEECWKNPPKLGYLTISNALQWRLQYKRVIKSAGGVDGILKVL